MEYSDLAFELDGEAIQPNSAICPIVPNLVFTLDMEGEAFDGSSLGDHMTQVHMQQLFIRHKNAMSVASTELLIKNAKFLNFIRRIIK